MIRRRIKQHVTDALDRQAAVALIGPRQVGKTTLAHEIGEQRGALYLDLEDSEDRGGRLVTHGGVYVTGIWVGIDGHQHTGNGMDPL